MESADQGYSWHTHTEVLVQGDERTALFVTVRFLQLRPPQTDDGLPDIPPRPDGWYQAAERVVQLACPSVADLALRRETMRTPFSFDSLAGHAELSAEPLAAGL